MQWVRKLTSSSSRLHLKSKLHHLISTLRPEQFTNSLIKKPAKNIDELRNEATQFMQIKELHDYHKNVQVDNGGDKEKEKDRGSDIYLVSLINSEITAILSFMLIPH